ncbi:hypothetical protein DLJ53_21965 [Acuticoccus sediminis]|uniref:Single-stranded DNA-binding protein n=1 Tax=Acuticoccus sediminis TaxID=2184697 RepID=A0A8B2NI43_9HYPH|nr:hypothetical protein DLJ53_21965 [Acuticoccus sediminis]
MHRPPYAGRSAGRLQPRGQARGSRSLRSASPTEATVNRVQLIGYVGGAPETRQTPNGTHVATFQSSNPAPFDDDVPF